KLRIAKVNLVTGTQDSSTWSLHDNKSQPCYRIRFVLVEDHGQSVVKFKLFKRQCKLNACFFLNEARNYNAKSNSVLEDVFHGLLFGII
ncbi:MAG: hypothetical protein MZV63_56770, partial [Marinilabiliales bacterium]|nr:hypothetical protein [Marinilabiliales bacterium]